MKKSLILNNLFSQAQHQGTKTALRTLTTSINYSDLLHQIERTVVFLRGQGVNKNSVICSYLDHGPDAIILFYASLIIESVYLPLDVTLGKNEILQIFELISNGKSVLCGHHLFVATNSSVLEDQFQSIIEGAVNIKPDLRFVSLKLVSDHDQVSEKILPDLINDSGASQLPRLLLLSSGSTGIPKVMMINQASLDQRILNVVTAIEHFSQDLKTLCAVPLSHSHGLECLALSTLYLGGEVVLYPPAQLSPLHISTIIQDFQISFFSTIPLFYEMWMKYFKPEQKSMMSSLKLPFCGSAYLSMETAKNFHSKTGIYLRQGYGVTEVCMIAMHRLDKIDHQFTGHVGNAVPELSYRVVGGELQILSKAMCSGYLSVADEVWSSKFTDHYFSTGDLIEIDEEQRIYVKGRKDDLIEISGQKFYPWEIEDYVMKNFDLSCCGLVFKSVLTLFLEQGLYSEQDCEPLKNLIKNNLEKNFSSFKHPRNYVWLKEIPKSPLGKVLKSKLLDLV